MKKTLLATAIAGAMVYGATAAQAATVYDQDGTQVDVYGRINLGVTTGGYDGSYSAFDATTGEEVGVVVKESGSEFVDVFSRFGFRARHQVSPDLQVFANMEFRPQLNAQNTDSMQIRNSFVGLQGDSWGMVRVGNFDGVLYQAVTSNFEIQEYEGFTSTSGGATSARGDSIQYSTPNLQGFQAHVQAKHLSGNNRNDSETVRLTDGQEVLLLETESPSAIAGDGDNSSTVSWQAAVNYEWQDLYLGLGYNQSKDVSDRGARYAGGANNPAGEDIWAAAALYQFTPAFRAGLKYEEVTDLVDNPSATAIENLWTVMGVFDYGMGEIYADYNRVRMAQDGVDSQNRWTLGANYRFSQPMYVWAEVVDYDFDSEQAIEDITDDLRFTVGLRYDF
ncbi:porin [Billgrantia kenyensis]|uniref:Porin n=1 Tax=Billgrantia kenyensis TaxID=321266 RepID=A0A7W0AE44_9GAMM|nr:porin [Halomonas kenyensis]MBA2779170.1 porin [Halomonas kenyensis]MCG6660810.1 porin [Halomonas kenyensis]